MTRKRLSATLCFLLVCCAALVGPAAAQHFKVVKGTLTQVAAGRNEVFGIGTANQVYRYNAGTQTFVQIPGSLALVAVGGGILSQKDEVWGVSPSGKIYHFNYGTETFTQVAGSLVQIVVGGVVLPDIHHPYEVWGLDASDNIYRYNYSIKQFEQIGGLARLCTSTNEAAPPFAIFERWELGALLMKEQQKGRWKVRTIALLRLMTSTTRNRV